MDNKYFRLPDDSDLLRDVDSVESHFKTLGDLESENEDEYFRLPDDRELLRDDDSEDKYFQNARDLRLPDDIEEVRDADRRFKQLGDLENENEDEYFRLPDDRELLRDDDSEDKYFQASGDLILPDDIEELRDADKHFRALGDLDEEVLEKDDLRLPDEQINTSLSSLEKINNYLLTVVSGKRYEPVCELGVLMGGGRMVVNLQQLQNLVDTGHNIIWANVINADRGLIEIEVQKYVYDEELMEKRRRF